MAPLPSSPVPGRVGDLAGVPDLAHGEATAGPLRRRRPVYRDLLAPCASACPANEAIPTWLIAARDGEFERAWRTIVETNPLPAIHGRACYHPCEVDCNRGELDTAVSIHGVERFVGDAAIERGWELPRPARSTRRRVLVIGSGPCGLSAAYHLARLGHDVEVRDQGERPGGMLRYGIPAYRLPRDVLDAEVARLEQMGITFTSSHRVDDLDAERREGGFEAVFAAVGAQLSKRVDLPAQDAGRLLDALGFLRQVAEGERPLLGRRVAVYGGGNTAMDAARTARRLGAQETLVVYRRTRAQMPAHAEEAFDAEREGVRINWLRTITAVGEGELQVEVMELDGDGRARGTGRYETLAADTVIVAVGQDADTAFLRPLPGLVVDPDGTVEVSGAFATGCPGVFAGGDVVPGERSITVSVGHGAKAAAAIDAALTGRAATPPAPMGIATFESLHLWYFGDAAARRQPVLTVEDRLAGFDEVVGGLDAAAATFEAGRCLSCGTCVECDGCLGACPEDAVIKLGDSMRYTIDLARCTGCGACVAQCPVNAMAHVDEAAP